MKRLTKKAYHEEENYFTIEFQNVEPHELSKIKEQLYEYEEIGLTTDEIIELKNHFTEKTGKWQNVQGTILSMYECSNCYHNSLEPYLFCPKCNYFMR